MKIVSKPKHGETLMDKEGRASRAFQLYLDDLEQRVNDRILGNAFILPSYTVATLPAVVEGGLIYVSDETGGATTAFSDGTNWRRSQDRTVVS